MAAAFDIAALTKRRLQAHVFETLPKDRWYTTVVDKNALRVLSSHMKLSDLLEYNVSVVDPLEISRKPSKDVVYIISPLPTSMKRVLEDFQGPKPLYESARIFFTSKATEELLDMVKACSPLVKRLQALKEIHTEFENVDERTFTTGCPDALPTLFGRDMSREARQSELHKTAQRLATIFTTLKTRPNSIVVRTPTELPDLPNAEARRAVCRDLGTLVQKRLSKWSLADSNLFTASGCDLIIVDRGHDPVAPVIHPFHYASITHDLVPMKNGVFKYTWKNAAGEEQSSEHVVDSTDTMWADLRHTHVAEVVEVATSKLKEFTNSRLARVEREGVANAKIGNATASLPEYLAKKAHLSMHVELTSSIFQRVNERDLISLGRLEQELVFGEKKSNDIILHLQGWNNRRASGVPTLEDVMRLLLCYFTTHPGRLEPSHQERWASVAHLSPTDMHSICNVQYLGVELQKTKKASMFSFKRRKANKALRVERSTDTRALDCGRFQPLMVDTFNEFVASKLPTGPGKDFDLVPVNSEFDAIPQAATSLGAKSVRTSSRPTPTWHKRAGSTGMGSASLDDVALRSRKVVIFVVGGCTWSEIQSAHELSQQHGVEVVLGSTSLIESGEDFLRDMGRLAPYGVATESVAIDMRGSGSAPGSRQGSGAGSYRRSR